MLFILDVSASTLRTYSRNNPNALLVRSNGQTTPHFRVQKVMCRCNNRNCPTNFELCSRLVDILHNLREEFAETAPTPYWYEAMVKLRHILEYKRLCADATTEIAPQISSFAQD